ncbi:hypothetical protein [Rugosimonospora africana]|uniref:Uncharacterized protein n=1 Tax=Rugosimonospora africana TaxID=556532 RepID=A0A8J3QPY7_9ACTN|nr:hypothetical protein [Rugosimonospora africana]GIH14132.1 hypothetical protein Raf01_23040 [Rugosimonospora africana]
MSTDSRVEPPSVATLPEESARRASARWLPVARFVVAAAGSVALCLLIWSRVPRTLSGPIDIIGYPTFHDFDYMPAFWKYRLVIYGFPALFVVFYALLAWRGPLRRDARPARSGPVRLLEPLDEPRGPVLASATDRLRLPSGEDPAREAGAFTAGVLPRIALPMLVVVVATSTRNGSLDWFAGACGLLYVLAVLAGAALWSRLAASGRIRWRSGESSFWHGVSLANGAGGAVAAVLCVWFVSRHTVAFTTSGHEQTWPWLPLWLAVLGAGAVLCWTLFQLNRGRPASAVERALLITVIGSVALFIVVAVLPGPLKTLQGFDDSQGVLGAKLLGQGAVPWRDITMIHGPYYDVFRAGLGTSLFGNTMWGSVAGEAMLLVPLSRVILYLYTAWASKGNPWLLTAVAIASAGGFFPASETRFMAVPLAVIVLGEAIRRNSRAWYVGLVLVLFVQAVLVPETSFFALPALACVVAVDVVHRDPGVRLLSLKGLWRVLRRTRWCVGTGVVATLVLALVLVLIGALRGFIDYYTIFGPGHDASGAQPPIMMRTRDYAYFGAGIVAVLITVWMTVARVRRRGNWQARDWSLVAAAGFAALYGEKLLGRFDQSHSWQVFTACLPLLVLLSARALPVLDRVFRWVPAQMGERPTTSPRLAGALLIALVVAFSNPLPQVAQGLAGHYRLLGVQTSSYPELGYATPDAIDLAMVDDLNSALRTYAGDGSVFDMTNSLGYVYYLLDRKPPTSFIHVSMAVPPFAQQLLIDDLKKARPAVVVFDATSMGLPRWDGVDNNVRHYEVSDYILDNWVPVMRTDGNLIMVRRDLVAKGLPPAPTLLRQPETKDLWFSGRSCSWGTSAAFLPSVPVRGSTTLRVRPVGTSEVVDISGWAADPTTGQPAASVVIANGQKVMATLTPSRHRPDVTRALHSTASDLSGFQYGAVLPQGSAAPSVFMLGADGTLHPLIGSHPDPVSSLRMPNGRVLPTSDKVMGAVDSNSTQNRVIGQVEVPPGTDLTGYDLARFSAGDRPVGDSDIHLGDTPGLDSRTISARSLSRLGTDLTVPVGSCPQWRGYDPDKPLYVTQLGGAPVQTVTLSKATTP